MQVLQLASERQFVQALHARQLLRNDLSPLCIAREPIDDAVRRGSPHGRARATQRGCYCGIILVAWKGNSELAAHASLTWGTYAWWDSGLNLGKGFPAGYWSQFLGCHLAPAASPSTW